MVLSRKSHIEVRPNWILVSKKKLKIISENFTSQLSHSNWMFAGLPLSSIVG
jgi:hypothetical protein